MGHHGVPEGRGDAPRPDAVVGQDQDRRADGHQLPGEQERDHVGGSGHQLHPEGEDRERRSTGAGRSRPGGVADPKTAVSATTTRPGA